MRRIFADAGYWIALLNPKDAGHERARQVSSTLGQAWIITSEMVLTELLNAFASKGNRLRETACSAIQNIRSNPNGEVVPMTSTAFRQAMTRYCARSDKTWGLTDCTSFLVMEEKGITEALSFDHDFEQAGFRALLLE